MRYIKLSCLIMRCLKLSCPKKGWWKLSCLKMRCSKMSCPKMGCTELSCLRNIVNLLLPSIITCSGGCKKLPLCCWTFLEIWLQFWYMVEKNWVGHLGLLWSPFNILWECILGHCLRINHLLILDAESLDNFWSNLFSKSMTLLSMSTRYIRALQLCIFGT